MCGGVRRDVTRAKAERMAEGRIIKSLPCSVKILISIPIGNRKPSKGLGQFSDAKCKSSFFPQEGMYIHTSEDYTAQCLLGKEKQSSLQTYGC